MKTEEIWWTRLSNSVRFLEDARDALLSGRSVVMTFPDEVPWQDVMTDTLEQHLFPITDERSFEVHDVSESDDDPGLYLFNNFCSETERAKYWPATHGSYEKFLAASDNVRLNRRIVCITGLSVFNTSRWVKSVNEYLAGRNSEQRGIFILVSQKVKSYSTDFMECFDFEEYVSDYDCRMLCLTLLSSVKCSSSRKQYISEIAAGIAKNDVTKAGILASAGLQLAMYPYETAKWLYSENGLSDENLEKHVKSAVWSAQIRLVFPEIEEFRSGMICRYEKNFERFLPISSLLGEQIYRADDLEIGHLYILCTNHKVINQPEYDKLVLMRKFRNRLAHCDVIPYPDLNAWL